MPRPFPRVLSSGPPPADPTGALPSGYYAFTVGWYAEYLTWRSLHGAITNTGSLQRYLNQLPTNQQFPFGNYIWFLGNTPSAGTRYWLSPLSHNFYRYHYSDAARRPVSGDPRYQPIELRTSGRRPQVCSLYGHVVLFLS